MLLSTERKDIPNSSDFKKNIAALICLTLDDIWLIVIGYLLTVISYLLTVISSKPKRQTKNLAAVSCMSVGRILKASTTK